MCWIHGRSSWNNSPFKSLHLLSSKCKLDKIRTLSVDLLKLCANLQEQQSEVTLCDAPLSPIVLVLLSDFEGAVFL